MRSGIIGFLFISAVSLQGCASAGNSFYGPIRPFQSGKMGDVKSCPPDNGLREDFLEDRFVLLGCSSAADSGDDPKARKMLAASFSLTNQRCNDFFASKAGKQTGINIVRSSIAPVLTLLTGVLSIVNFKNDVGGNKRADWEKGLSLASTATLSGLSIYEENFLFSAENIEDVRQLTKRAMSEYRVETLKLQNHTFDTNIDYLLEYHMICTPGGIKNLVKKAISSKTIAVVKQSPAAPAAPAPSPAAANAGVGLGIQ